MAILRRVWAGVLALCFFTSTLIVSPVSGNPADFQLSGGPVTIFTNDLSGSIAVGVWSNESFTDMTVETYFLNETYYPDEEIYNEPYLNGSFVDYLANVTYNRTVTVSSSPELRVSTVGGTGVVDIDLGLFLNGKDGNPLDGMAQAGEFIEYSATASSSELVSLVEPENGTYIVKVAGYEVSGDPGYFDLRIGVVEGGTGWMYVTNVPPGAIPTFTLVNFDLHWEFPGATADNWYYAGLYIGHASDSHVTYIPVSLKLDRSPPEIVEVLPESPPSVEDLRPFIYGILWDPDGELSRDSIRLLLDGVNITYMTDVHLSFSEDPDGKYGYYSGLVLFTPLYDIPFGLHQVTLEVGDYAGNIAQRQWSFVTADETPPVIYHTPETMSSEGYVIPITARVHENFTLGDISLMYRRPGDPFYLALLMNQVDQSNNYVATIPPQQFPLSIQYYLSANDSSGNSATLPGIVPASNPFEIEIQPFGFPRITHKPVEAHTRENITVTVLVSDDQAISSVNLFYKNASATIYNSTAMVNLGGHVYEGMIPGSAISQSSMHYYIEASDGVNAITHPLDSQAPHLVLYVDPPPPGEEMPLEGSPEVMKVAVMEDVELDPRLASNPTSKRIIDLLYDSLGRRDPNTLEIVPWVASSWSADEASGLLTVALRPEAKWHDGSQVTAEDVRYTFEDFYGGYDVTVISPTSVVFNFSAGGGGRFMTSGLLMPLVESGDINPVEGGGPFELVSYSPTHTLVEAFPDYFMKGPILGGVDFIRVSGINEAANAFINGTIDFIGWELEFQDLTDPRIGGRMLLLVEEAAIRITPGLDYLYFGLNPNASNSLDDLNLRLSISKLVNKELLDMIEPFTRMTHSVMSNRNIPWYNSSLREFNAGYTVIDGRQATNRYPAVAHLESSGYFDLDDDGWREKPDGQNLSLSVLGPSLADDLRKATVAQVLAEGLGRVGLNATAVLDSSADPADYDIYLSVGHLSLDPSDISSIGEIASFVDAELSLALQEADDALNVTERSAHVKEALGMISEKVPLIPVLRYETGEIYNETRFEGWVQMPGGINDFWSFVEVYSLFDTVTDRPLGLHAFLNQDSNITLTWKANEEVDLQGYAVYRSSGSGGPYQLIDEVAPRTSFVDPDMGPNGDYCYVVTAKDSSIESSPSSEACLNVTHLFTPPSISDVRVNPSPQEVHGYVNVSAVVEDVSGVEGVWIDVTGVGNYSMYYDSLAGRYYNNRSYSDVGTFSFTISATDVFGNWASTPGEFVMEDTTPPTISHIPVTSTVVGDSIEIVAVVTDNLQVSLVKLNFTDAGGSSHNQTMTLSGDNYTYQIPAQDSTGSVSYFVWAEDTEGNVAMTAVFIIEISPDTLSPSAPTDLIVTTGDEEGALSLSWTAPANNTDGSPLTDLAGYNIYRMTSSGGPKTLVNDNPVSTTTFLDTALENGKTYYYVVTAVDNRGNESPDSDEAFGATKSVEQFDWLWILIPLIVVIAIVVLLAMLILSRRRGGTAEEPEEPPEEQESLESF
ncbi:MAG: ABC transporter substrate-binding protein [Thermoplasmata archaeon]